MPVPVMGSMEKLGVQIGLVLAVGIMVSWVALCAQTGWLLKTTALYSLDISLFQVEWKQGAVGGLLTGALSVVSPKVANFLKNINPLQKKYSPQEFRDYMCSLKAVASLGLGDLCQLWDAVLYATWAMIFAIALGTIFLAVGSVLLCQWAFVKPKAENRTWARICYTVACFLYSAGTTQYCLVTHYTNQMPPSSDATALGPPAMIAVMLTMLSYLPLLVSVTFIRQTYEEATNENLSAQKKFAREQDKYGAVEAGVGPLAGGAGQPGQLQTQEPWPTGGSWNQPTAPYPGAFDYSQSQMPMPAMQDAGFTPYGPAPTTGVPGDGGATAFGLAPAGGMPMDGSLSSFSPAPAAGMPMSGASMPMGGADMPQDGSTMAYTSSGMHLAPPPPTYGATMPPQFEESLDGPAPLRRGPTAAMPAMPGTAGKA